MDRPAPIRLTPIKANILSGGATAAAAIAIQAEIASARAELLSARDTEAAGRAMLARWIGNAAQQRLAQNSLPICRPADKSQVAALLDNHPLLEVARRQNRVADSAIAIARADRQNVPITGDDAFSFGGTMMTMKTIGIARRQVRGSKRTAASARLIAQGAVSAAEQDVLARRIHREVMLGWTEIVVSQQKREVLEFLIRKLEARQETPFSRSRDRLPR